jgi:hypothetical protein
LEALGKQQGMAGSFNDLMIVVIVALMVWKPGL